MNISFLLLVIYMMLYILPPPCGAEEKSYEPQQAAIKCGTPDIMDNLAHGVAKTLQLRPTMDTSASSTHFKVHYDTTGYHAPKMADSDKNGIPDYVDSTLVFLEYAWDLEINQLGYPVPLSDGDKGGDSKIDIYLKEMYTVQGQVYGQTVPDNSSKNSTSSYIEIDNDFSNAVYATKGYDALKVTTAHEFFHTIHFTYFYNMDLIWWMEHTAVWMEDRAWDNVNDYLSYLYLFFGNNQTPLNSTGTFMYGAALWAHYLAKSFGDDIIRQIWDHLSNLKTIDIAAFDEVIPIGLDNALGQFAVWNYFTADRANTVDFYHDSDLFNESVSPDISTDTSPFNGSMSTQNLTTRYLEFLFVGNWGAKDTIRINVFPEDNGQYARSLIFFNSPFDYKIHALSSESEDIPLEKKWLKAILTVTSSNTRSGSYQFNYETQILDGVIHVEEENEPVQFTVHGVFPNPFNLSTVIQFTIPDNSRVIIDIYNIAGQKIQTLVNDVMKAGTHSVTWDAGKYPSGVYIYKVKAGKYEKTMKMILLK